MPYGSNLINKLNNQRGQRIGKLQWQSFSTTSMRTCTTFFHDFGDIVTALVVDDWLVGRKHDFIAVYCVCHVAARHVSRL